MDCDFSHDPADVPRLIAVAEDGADLVLGSRYVDGGQIGDWGRIRRFVSAGGSWYARTWLGVPVRDLTGGFKCYRRAALEAIPLDAIHARGYAFQIETTYRVLRQGGKVVEVPITFVDRKVGGSKMAKTIVLEAIWKVPALRLRALGGRLVEHRRRARGHRRELRAGRAPGRGPGRGRLLGAVVRPVPRGRAGLVSSSSPPSAPASAS